MRSFQSSTAFSKGYEVVKTPTYLLARDEDCENAFHSTADFVSLLQSFCFLLTLADEYVSCEQRSRVIFPGYSSDAV
jgi:hypothetical protein